MRDMTLSPLAIQLGIAAILVLSIAVSTLSFCAHIAPGWRRADDSSESFRSSSPIGPYGVRPRAARLMAPIQQVSTREGDFQVWSDLTTDKARIGIPLDIALGPNDTGRGRALPAKDAQLTAWLFLPPGADPSELMLVDGSDHLRACRFSVAPNPENVSTHDDASRRT
jgi:hypothetical protein